MGGRLKASTVFCYLHGFDMRVAIISNTGYAQGNRFFEIIRLAKRLMELLKRCE